MATIHYIVNTAPDGTQFTATNIEDSIALDLKRVMLPQPGDIMLLTKRSTGDIEFTDGLPGPDDGVDFPPGIWLGRSFVAIMGSNNQQIRQGQIWFPFQADAPGDRITVTGPHAGDGAFDYFSNLSGIDFHFRRFTGDKT